MINLRKPGWLLPAALGTACLFSGCKSSAPPRVEQPVTVAAPAPRVEPEPAKLGAPTIGDVKTAIQRVFGDDVVLSSAFPAFISGDLNGDGFEDLAVVVHPAPGKLGDINNELSNWILFDADKYFIAPMGKSVVIPPVIARPRIEEEDILAVIHGHGPNGWRNPEARQSYLVKHAAANYSGKVSSLSEKKIRGLKLAVKSEVLKGERNHRKGFLFWTGTAYAWQDAN